MIAFLFVAGDERRQGENERILAFAGNHHRLSPGQKPRLNPFQKEHQIEKFCLHRAMVRLTHTNTWEI